MKRSRFLALLGALFAVSYLIAFVVQRERVLRKPAGQAEPVAVTEEEPAQAGVQEFPRTADAITMGSGIQPEPPAGPLAGYDLKLRQMTALRDGAEKLQLAREIAAVRDRAAAPVLLDWAVSTNDRVVLRSALEALGPLADAELIAEIQRRFAAAFRDDDRYRLAKAIRNITNPEATAALIDLANDPDAPPRLAIAATDALATLATPPAISVLFEKLETAPPDETGRLATAIARIDRAEALPALQYAALGNKDASSDAARVAAIHALANFRSEETRDVLQRLAADPAVPIREAARGVLARYR